ncbi:MAG: right-handed parallel beta-helix repeat-containing protein [Candidatus Paceibacterota bacterium]|jgi:hypothetical protein
MKKIFFRMFFGPLFLGAIFFVSAYHSGTTHPGITEQGIEFYNLQSITDKIHDSEKRLIIQGSVDEDAGIRALNHFYDPRGEIGFNNYRSAKDWGTDGVLVANEFSWPKAIQYYAEGNDNKAFLSLGHVLHLIQDMTVPEHTRNDPHKGDGASGLYTGDSPYENWARRKDGSALTGTAKEYVDRRYEPITFSDISEYFEYLADYSNKNFFSADTIDNSENYFENPEIENSDGSVIYGVDGLDNQKYEILNTKISLDGVRTYYFSDSVLSSYFDRLSKQAVLASAGVIELFLKEAKAAREEYLAEQKQEQVEEALKDKELAEGLAKKNIFQLIPIGFAYLFSDYIGAPVAKVATSAWRGANYGTLWTVQTGGNIASVLGYTGKTTATVVAKKTGESAQTFAQSAIKSITFLQSKTTNSITTVLDEGEGLELNSTPSFIDQSKVADANFPTGVFAPFYNPTQVIYSGSNRSRHTASPGEPEVPVIPSPFLPELPGVTNFSVAECSQSLVSTGCLVATTTLTLTWQADESLGIAEYFTFNLNGLVSTTTYSGLSVVVDDRSDLQFTVSAHNAGGDSEPVAVSVSVATMPVVINEVAWMGTEADANDEWLELYNTTPYDIDLSGWALVNSKATGTPRISLSKTIPAHGYFLLERTDNTSVSDIQADLVYVGALNNSGVILNLNYGSTTIDTTVLVEGSWPGGSNDTGDKRTMERVSPYVGGFDYENWNANTGEIANGKDSKDGYILGTPKSRNSVSTVWYRGETFTEDMILTPEESPYVFEGNIHVASGTTLTLLPGTIVKFYDNGSWGSYATGLSVEGTIKSLGTSDNPVIFTEFTDDSVGGDLRSSDNGELSEYGTGATEFYSGSVGNVFGYTKIKKLEDGISAQASSSVVISNSTITGSPYTDTVTCRQCTLAIQDTSISGGDSIVNAYDGAEVTLSDVRAENTTGGINLYMDSHGIFSDLALSNISGDALSIYANSTAQVTRPNISRVDGVGVYVYDNSSAEISDADISYCGAGVEIFGNSLASGLMTITNSNISDNEAEGVGIFDDGKVVIASSTLARNEYGILFFGDSASVARSQIFGNRSNGILSTGENTILAQENWWGDATGPFEEIKNNLAVGDSVFGLVDFSPWFDAVPSGNPKLAYAEDPVTVALLSEAIEIHEDGVFGAMQMAMLEETESASIASTTLEKTEEEVPVSSEEKTEGETPTPIADEYKEPDNLESGEGVVEEKNDALNKPLEVLELQTEEVVVPEIIFVEGGHEVKEE